MKKTLVSAVAAASLFAVGVAPAAADHSWGSYHWSRTATTSFTLSLGDNLTSAWRANLVSVSSDWSRVAADPAWADATAETAATANPVRTRVVTGGTTGRKCRPSPSRIEVCNAAYGKNGWLGVASIWASGDHITQATVKLNDSYLASAPYNTPEWRQSVMCQEVGHGFGLDHQDESGADLDTCMDYSRAPNVHPDQHDYNQLGSMYAHADSSTAPGVTAASGRGLRRVREGLYIEDLGAGHKRIVWVFWKDRGRGHHADAPDDA